MDTKRLICQINSQSYRTIPAGFIILLMFAGWFTITTNTTFAATYYLDDTNGSDANAGGISTPWKTLAASQANTVSGDTVIARNGNYSDYTENPAITRTDWITYQAATGHIPVFTDIYIYKNTSPAVNTYLKFDGIKVQQPAPDSMPPDDGYRHLIGNHIT